MPYAMQVIQRVTLNGTTSELNVTVNGDNVVGSTPTVTAAVTGTLSTRTNNTDGTLTLAVGHNIATGDKFDLFWLTGTPGSRRACVAGTVSGQSVPFTGGSGDNLPTQGDAITAKKPQEEVLVATGNNVVGIHVVSDRKGYIVLSQSNDTVIIAIKIGTGGETYLWFNDSSDANPVMGANPLAGVSVGKVLASHDDSAASHTPVITLIHN